MGLLKTEHSGFRWRRGMGRPESELERMIQYCWRHRILIYLSIVCMLTFMFQVLGLRPLGGVLD